MTTVRLVVRAHHRADTLERISGVLRRRGFAVERLSVSYVSAGVEVVVRIDPNRTDPERVCRELLTLRDVIAIDTTGADAEIRELLMASVASGAADQTAGRTRMVQMIGAPEEIDAMVAWLESQKMMVRYVRSGEFAVPGPPVHPHPEVDR